MRISSDSSASSSSSCSSSKRSGTLPKHLPTIQASHSFKWTHQCTTKNCRGNLEYTSHPNTKIPRVSCPNNNQQLAQALKPLDSFIKQETTVQEINKKASRTTKALMKKLEKELPKFYLKIPTESFITRPKTVINPAIRRFSDCNFERICMPKPLPTLIPDGPTFVGLGSKTPTFNAKKLDARYLLDKGKSNNFRKTVETDFGPGSYSNAYWFSQSLPKAIRCPPNTHQLTSSQAKKLAFVVNNQERLPLQIRKSTIEKAGRGVFALANLPRNVLLIMYFGQQQTPFESWPPSDSVYDLGWIVDDQTHEMVPLVIEPTRKLNAARYINTAPTSDLNNLRIEKIFWKGQIGLALSTQREIIAGQQLFYDYGKSYGFTMNFEKILHPSIYSRGLSNDFKNLTRKQKEQTKESLRVWKDLTDEKVQKAQQLDENVQNAQQLDFESEYVAQSECDSLQQKPISSEKDSSNQSMEYIMVRNEQPMQLQTNQMPHRIEPQSETVMQSVAPQTLTPPTNIISQPYSMFHKQLTNPVRRNRFISELTPDMRDRVFMTFIRRKTLKYKHQFPRLTEGELTDKVQRDWYSQSADNKYKLYEDYKACNDLRGNDSTPQSERRRRPRSPGASSYSSQHSKPIAVVPENKESEPDESESESLDDYTILLKRYRELNGPHTMGDGEKPDQKFMQNYILAAQIEQEKSESSDDHAKLSRKYRDLNGPRTIRGGQKPDQDFMRKYITKKSKPTPKPQPTVTLKKPAPRPPALTGRVFVQQSVPHVDSDFERSVKGRHDFDNVSSSESEKNDALFKAHATDQLQLRHRRQYFKEVLQNRYIQLVKDEKVGRLSEGPVNDLFDDAPMRFAGKGMRILDKSKCRLCQKQVVSKLRKEHLQNEHTSIYWAALIDHHMQHGRIVYIWALVDCDGIYDPARWNIVNATPSRTTRKSYLRQMSRKGYPVSTNHVVMIEVVFGKQKFQFNNQRCPYTYVDPTHSHKSTGKKESLQQKKRAKQLQQSESSSSSSGEYIIEVSDDSPRSESRDSSESDSFGNHANRRNPQKRKHKLESGAQQRRQQIDSQMQHKSKHFESVQSELIENKSVNVEQASMVAQHIENHAEVASMVVQHIENQGESFSFSVQPMLPAVERSFIEISSNDQSESVSFSEPPMFDNDLRPVIQTQSQMVEHFVEPEIQEQVQEPPYEIIFPRPRVAEEEPRQTLALSSLLTGTIERERRQQMASHAERMGQIRRVMRRNHGIRLGQTYHNTAAQLRNRQQAHNATILEQFRHRNVLRHIQDLQLQRDQVLAREIQLQQQRQRVPVLTGNIRQRRVPLQDRINELLDRMGLFKTQVDYEVQPANPPPQLTIAQHGYCNEMDERINRIDQSRQAPEFQQGSACFLCGYQLAQTFDATRREFFTREHYEELSVTGPERMLERLREVYLLINRRELAQCQNCNNTIHHVCFIASVKGAAETYTRDLTTFQFHCPFCRMPNTIHEPEMPIYPEPHHLQE